MAFREMGLNYAFMAFDVGTDRLKDAVTGLRALNIRGFSVSMPNKTTIIPLLDELSPEARIIGAVNTVVNENGKFVGYNTDGVGFMRSLAEAGVHVAGRKMTLLGAGGAAVAIAVQAAFDGVSELSIFNRRDAFFAQAMEIAAAINDRIEGVQCKAAVYGLEDQEQLKKEVAASDILTNATSVGMKPLEGQSLIPDTSWLRPDLVVSDVIYNPRKSKLLEQAEAVGCRTINGIGMVLYQGAAAFKLWTGQEMPVESIKNQLFQLERC
jgi:shikimate dehydrogenase